MSDAPFNRLTPAQAERLAMLAEEAGEIVQAVGKILRHGYDSHHPRDPDQKTNKELLRREIVDLMAVFRLMGESGDVDDHIVRLSEIEGRIMSKLTYTHHQGFEGSVKP